MNRGTCRFGWRVMPRLLAGFLAAGILSGMALADAESYKRITEGHIDSQCIGDVSDPVCAIETWNACYALERPELCALLGVEGMRFKPDAQPNIIEYRIIEVLPVASDRAPPRLRNMPWFIHAQLEVRVAERACTSDCKQLSEHSFGPYIYYLRPDGGEWRLVAWTNDVSVTCEYPEPEHPACDFFFWDRATPWVHDQSLYDSYN